MKLIGILLAVLAIVGMGIAVYNMGHTVVTKAATQSEAWENLK